MNFCECEVMIIRSCACGTRYFHGTMPKFQSCMHAVILSSLCVNIHEILVQMQIQNGRQRARVLSGLARMLAVKKKKSQNEKKSDKNSAYIPVHISLAVCLPGPPSCSKVQISTCLHLRWKVLFPWQLRELHVTVFHAGRKSVSASRLKERVLHR